MGNITQKSWERFTNLPMFFHYTTLYYIIFIYFIFSFLLLQHIFFAIFVKKTLPWKHSTCDVVHSDGQVRMRYSKTRHNFMQERAEKFHWLRPLRQNLTSTYVTFWRIKTPPALKGLTTKAPKSHYATHDILFNFIYFTCLQHIDNVIHSKRKMRRHSTSQDD